MIIGYDLNIWNEHGMKHQIEVNPLKTPSISICGSSGSGKSVATIYMLRNLLECVDCELTVLDFKRSDDLAFLEGYTRYYTYMECGDALEKYHQGFMERQGMAEKQQKDKLHICLIEELAAFIYRAEAEDKKLATRYKAIIGDILMLGRSRNYGVWTVCQRPDSVLYSNGARENYFVRILLGNASTEARKMVIGDAEIPKGKVYSCGEGVAWIDFKGYLEIKIPKIMNLNALKLDIKKGIARNM